MNPRAAESPDDPGISEQEGLAHAVYVVKTRGPVRPFSCIVRTLTRLLAELRHQTGDLPLTAILHGRGKRLEKLIDQLPLRDGDAVWLITRESSAEPSQVPRFAGSINLDLAHPRDRRLYDNLFADIAYFAAVDEEEEQLAAGFGRRARAILIDREGGLRDRLRAALAQASGDTAKDALAATFWWAGGAAVAAAAAEPYPEPSLVPQNEELAAIGRQLREAADRLEGERDRFNLFRARVEEVGLPYRQDSKWRADLIRQADANRWPAWTIRGLAYLYVPLADLVDGRSEALVWHHFLAGLRERGADEESDRRLCDGQIREARISTLDAALLSEVQVRFESSLLEVGIKSERAFVAWINHVLTEIEQERASSGDEAAAERLQRIRKRILAEGEVLK
jgi:hypothetical protein